MSDNVSSTTPLVLLTQLFCLSMDDFLQEDAYYRSMWIGQLSDAYAKYHVMVAGMVSCLGLLANAAFTTVLRRPTMRKTVVNRMLVAVAVFDSALMAMNIAFNFIYYTLGIDRSYLLTLSALVYADLAPVIHSTSLWLTVVMGAFRCFVIRDRGSRRRTSRLQNLSTFFTAVLVFIVVAVMHAPNMLRNQVIVREPNTENTSYLIERPLWWNCDWERTNFFMVGLFSKLIPCALMLLFVGVMLQVLTATRRRRMRLLQLATTERYRWRRKSPVVMAHSRRTALLLLVIVSIFLLAELPHGLLVLAVAYRPRFYVLYYLFLGDLLDLMALLNSGVNLLLYCAISAQFRSQFSSAWIDAKARLMCRYQATSGTSPEVRDSSLFSTSFHRYRLAIIMPSLVKASTKPLSSNASSRRGMTTSVIRCVDADSMDAHTVT